jgi:hypothetical protein
MQTGVFITLRQTIVKVLCYASEMTRYALRECYPFET